MIDLNKTESTIIIVNNQFKTIINLFNLLNINHNSDSQNSRNLIFKGSQGKIPNIIFGLKVRPDILYLVTSLLRSSGHYRFWLALNYSQQIENPENTIYIGSGLYHDDLSKDNLHITNLSTRITPEEILNNEFLKFNISDYMYNFPCAGRELGGKIEVSSYPDMSHEEYIADLNEQDFRSNLEPYEGYNDNLDLDQQDESFYDQ